MKRGTKTKIIAAVLVASMTAAIAVTGSSTPAQAAKLGFKTLNMKVGQKKKIVIKNRNGKAKYTYKSSSAKTASVNKNGMIVAKKPGKATISVNEKLGKKPKLIGKITVRVKDKDNNKQGNSSGTDTNVINTTVPAVNTTLPPQANNTTLPQQSSLPQDTAEPTPEPTQDIYSEEVLTLFVEDIAGKKYEVKGATCNVTMQYFNGYAESDYFKGNIIKESSNVIKEYKEEYNDGKTINTARYILKGNDSSGSACSIFIEDNGTKNADGSIVTRPTIITDSKELEWLQTADVQGRVEDEGDGNKVIHIMWNKDNEEPVPYPAVTRPDETKNYNKEIFTFLIDIGNSDGVSGADGASGSMIYFGCTADSDTFVGTGVGDNNNFADTRMQFKGQVQTLSARYILSGQDSNGNDCSVYVENNGIDDNGMVTEPTIITDNPEWAWIETASLHGTVSWGNKLTIHMWAAVER